MGSDGEYTEFYTVAERPIAGMMAMPERMAGIPSHWLPYFQVADCDASLAKIQELGGSVLVAATDIPHTGRFGVLRDPQGAVSAIIQMETAE